MNDQNRDSAVDCDIICTVRLSIIPGDEMLSIKVTTNAFLRFFSVNLYLKSIITLFYDLDKI